MTTVSLDSDPLRLRYEHTRIAAAMKDFGEAVRTARRSHSSTRTPTKSIGVREFAAMFDVRYQLMHDVERGCALLPDDKMKAVCRWLLEQ